MSDFDGLLIIFNFKEVALLKRITNFYEVEYGFEGQEEAKFRDKILDMPYCISETKPDET